MAEERSKRRRMKTSRFDVEDYENEDVLLYNQALENSRRETKRVHVAVPDAPTFYPSLQEFKDPLKYIASIRPSAQKYGLCKIVPPAEWNPPSNIDMGDLRLCPTKLQRLDTLQHGNNVFPDGKSYSIGDYKAMADKFLHDWCLLHYDGNEVTHEQLQKDYWDIVEIGANVVQVEYANDLDTSRYTSGFPTLPRSILDAARKAKTNEDITNPDYYATTDWNLNNVAHSFGSILKRLETPINGINVPWLYLGMPFTTFCWHNEDNYLYSINYSHFGDAKQWYGVPGDSAPQFEKVVRDFYRETVIESPDILHHMTTQISVSRLVNKDIPVYQVKQTARTFVITFPKAFHCGFSYGFNCGEAVNFAAPDWLGFGSDADFRYRTSVIPRQSVFSHVRLIFTLANYANELDSDIKYELFKQIERVLNEEIDARAIIQQLRIPDISKHADTKYTNNFLAIDQTAADYDDQRMCSLCKQVCVFSAIACECSTSEVACIRHFHVLCKCDKKDEIRGRPHIVPKKGAISPDGNGHLAEDDQLAKSKKKNTKFLISWASAQDMRDLLENSRRILLGVGRGSVKDELIVTSPIATTHTTR